MVESRCSFCSILCASAGVVIQLPDGFSGCCWYTCISWLASTEERAGRLPLPKMVFLRQTALIVPSKSVGNSAVNIYSLLETGIPSQCGCPTQGCFLHAFSALTENLTALQRITFQIPSILQLHTVTSFISLFLQPVPSGHKACSPPSHLSQTTYSRYIKHLISNSPAFKYTFLIAKKTRILHLITKNNKKKDYAEGTSCNCWNELTAVWPCKVTGTIGSHCPHWEWRIFGVSEVQLY